MSEDANPSGTVRFFMGLAFAAAGTFPILAAFDVGPFKSESINGPPWIAVVAGGVFVGGALFLWFQETVTRLPWLGSAFALLIVAAFAALANWIAFGEGPRECSGTVSVAMFTGARWVSGLECRIAFGIGAMMCNGLLLMIAGNGLKQAGVTNRLPWLLDKAGTGLLVLALAPIVLVFIAAKLVEQGARWGWSRISSSAAK